MKETGRKTVGSRTAIPGLLALSCAVLAAPLLGGASPAPVPHELHETYADIAVEADVVGGRIRFFKGQLEAALGPILDADAVDLRPGVEADALVLRYLREHLSLEADGVPLDLGILQSGVEEVGHHEGWWVVVRAYAPAAVERLRIVNTLQFELFEDQRNMMRIVRLPGGAPQTYYTAAGEEAVVIGRPPSVMR